MGAAAAATTLAATADASPSYSAWDRVAHCESSGNWHIDTGNGYYGGLQFSSSTWSAYGGHKYAHQADNASRTEQIEVARRVLDAQGPGAWPVCGPRGGLTRSSGHATSAALPAHAGDSAGASHVVKAAHKAKHRAHTAAHASSTGHKAKHAQSTTYKVHAGDTLAGIAAKKHVSGGWKAIYKANKSTVHNPNVIPHRPGPAPAVSSTARPGGSSTQGTGPGPHLVRAGALFRGPCRGGRARDSTGLGHWTRRAGAFPRCHRPRRRRAPR